MSATERLIVDPQNPDAATIARAAEALRAGQLVAFPTETVYGLGAPALDAQAVGRVFAAKGRPADNPLIVHIADVADLLRVAAEVPPAAEALARRFWPGPLSLVLTRQPHVPDVTTGGLDSVAVRMPDHPVALALIRALGAPLAAPSANRSGRPSPTRAEHVLADFAGEVRYVLDAGPCRVGVESTVVDARRGEIEILRPGGISPEALAQLGVPVRWARAEGRPRAPGMKYRHYAPSAPVRLWPPAPDPQSLQEAAGRSPIALIASSELCAALASVWPGPIVDLGSRADLAGIASRLFAALRSADRPDVAEIWVEAVPEHGLGVAVMDRLRKAAAAAERH